MSAVPQSTPAAPILSPEQRRRKQDVELSKLRKRLWDRPEGAVVKLGGFRVRITDGPNAYMQYKDVFVRGIYRFDSAKTNPLVIDGGGNMGISVLGFKQQHPSARVLSFEPDPAIAALLEENVRRNKLSSDVKVIRAGLAGEAGTVRFAPDGSAGGQIDGSGTSSIEVVKLSDHLNEETDFLKLNIEGQELPVLQDLEKTGRLALVGRLVLEYHGWAGGQQVLGEILNLLDRNGFRYLVHDFDHETCTTTKPPFRYRPKAAWFCLVYGQRVPS